MTVAVEIALLARLLQRQDCHESERTQHLLRRYENAGWLARGSRKDQWKLRDDARSSLERRLDTILPSWKDDFALLTKHGRDPTSPRDVAALAVFRRQRSATGMVNRRNWNAISGLGPKRASLLETDADLTKDWVLRFRPNPGLVMVTDNGEVDLGLMAGTWTECLIPERAWRHLVRFTGLMPQCVITCENLGAYVDLPSLDNLLVVFAPGADTEPAIFLLKKLPESTWIHFGDLDPKGLAIAEQIATAAGRNLRLFIPSFAEEYLDPPQPAKGIWPQRLPSHPVLELLKARGTGIAQEAFMLDVRLLDEIARTCSASVKGPGAP